MFSVNLCVQTCICSCNGFIFTYKIFFSLFVFDVSNHPLINSCLLLKMQIRETPNRRFHRFIEYYDVRDAETALKALNRSEIGGKCIKLELSRPGGARRV